MNLFQSKVLAEFGNELVACQTRTFKECEKVKGHPELVKNIRHTSGKLSEFLSTTLTHVSRLRMEAVAAIRFGVYNAWVAAGASRALLGVRGEIFKFTVLCFLNCAEHNLSYLFSIHGTPNF